MEKTVTVKGIPVFYREKGEGDIILILHGWRASADSWIPVQDLLAGKGFRVIVPDLPGFMRTPEPKRPWAVGDYTDFVQAFIEKLGVHPRGLVGHSFGGRIAIFYAMRYGKDLPALVLCDAAGIFRHKQVRVRIYGILTKLGDLVITLSFLRIFRSPMRALWYRFTRERDYYTVDGTMRKTFKLVIEESMQRHLSKITTPTLILWGEKDLATPLSDARILHREIPVSSLYVFSGAGHAINLEVPKKVAHQIFLFLRR